MQTRPFFIRTTYIMVTFKTLPVGTIFSGETLLSSAPFPALSLPARRKLFNYGEILSVTLKKKKKVLLLLLLPL